MAYPLKTLPKLPPPEAWLEKHLIPQKTQGACTNTVLLGVQQLRIQSLVALVHATFTVRHAAAAASSSGM